MKQVPSPALLLVLLMSSVICQAELLARRFVVEHKQSHQSFFIKRDLNSVLGIPSDIADTNDYAQSIGPPYHKPHRPGGYWVEATFIESTSWQLICTTPLLVAYELFMTTHDAALSAKPYSWVPVEAFIAVGLLMKSYWNPGSSLFNPVGQRVASQHQPFAFTTTMLSGQNKQQSGQQSQPTASSGQQVPTTTRHTGTFTHRLSSGSSGGNGAPERHQHTFGLNCYAPPCHGYCVLALLSDGQQPVEWALNSPGNSTDCTGAATEQSPPPDIPGAIYLDTSVGLHNSLSVNVPDVSPEHRSPDCFINQTNTTTGCPPLDAVGAETPNRTGEQNCYESVGWVDSQRRPGDRTSDDRYKKRGYTGLQVYDKSQLIVCDETEYWEDGRQHRCRSAFKNAEELAFHKRAFHEQVACDETVVGQDGEAQPCRILFKNAAMLLLHKVLVHTKTITDTKLNGTKPNDDHIDHLYLPEDRK